MLILTSPPPHLRGMRRGSCRRNRWRGGRPTRKESRTTLKRKFSLYNWPINIHYYAIYKETELRGKGKIAG